MRRCAPAPVCALRPQPPPPPPTEATALACSPACNPCCSAMPAGSRIAACRHAVTCPPSPSCSLLIAGRYGCSSGAPAASQTLSDIAAAFSFLTQQLGKQQQDTVLYGQSGEQQLGKRTRDVVLHSSGQSGATHGRKGWMALARLVELRAQRVGCIAAFCCPHWHPQSGWAPPARITDKLPTASNFFLAGPRSWVGPHLPPGGTAAATWRGGAARALPVGCGEALLAAPPGGRPALEGSACTAQHGTVQQAQRSIVQCGPAPRGLLHGNVLPTPAADCCIPSHHSPPHSPLHINHTRPAQACGC